MNIPINGNSVFISAIILALLGFLQCFFGYRVFRITLALLGFFIGINIGVNLVHNAQPIVVVLVSLICGVLGGVLLYYLYFMGTFLAGIILGGSLAAIFAANLDIASNATTLIVVIGAIIGGILGIVLSKYIIMLSTALTGAAQIVYAALLLFSNAPSTSNVNSIEFSIRRSEAPVVTLAILVLAIVGFLVQSNVAQRPTRVEPTV